MQQNTSTTLLKVLKILAQLDQSTMLAICHHFVCYHHAVIWSSSILLGLMETNWRNVPLLVLNVILVELLRWLTKKSVDYGPKMLSSSFKNNISTSKKSYLYTYMYIIICNIAIFLWILVVELCEFEIDAKCEIQDRYHWIVPMPIFRLFLFKPSLTTFIEFDYDC